MGTDNLFHKRRSPVLKRKVGTKGPPKDRFLIVCEGERTEPNYFRSFRVTTVDVDVVGTGANTEYVVREAIKLKRTATPGYDQVWVVFDKDSFPAKHFNNAITLANQNNIKVAYSNEAFELWFLLHFYYFDSAITRNDYIVKLEEFLGRKYKKNDEEIYDLLLRSGNQQAAIKSAATLLAKHPENNPAKANPSTTVHLLVRELLRFV
jgi:hypothetical protein